MRHTPSKDSRNQKKAIIEEVYTLIHESYTTAQNMQYNIDLWHSAYMHAVT